MPRLNRTLTWLPLVLLVVGLLSACARPTAQEDADYQAFLRTAGKMYDSLGAVHNGAEFQAARSQLEQLRSQAVALKAKVDAMPKEHRQALARKYAAEVRQTGLKAADQARISIQRSGDYWSLNYLLAVADRVE